VWHPTLLRAPERTGAQGGLNSLQPESLVNATDNLCGIFFSHWESGVQFTQPELPPQTVLFFANVSHAC
jgi:hypothetical protein